MRESQPRITVRVLEGRASVPSFADPVPLDEHTQVRPVSKRRAEPAFDIPSLTGLRALSFLLVFAAHAGLPGVPGLFGVTVFFFLSGYLITTLLRLEVERSGTVRLTHFYLRRALRILPPFYVMLTLAAAVTAWLTPGELRVGPLIAQALHYFNYWVALHDWNGTALGTGVYWSLAVEEHFYLLFPAGFLWLYSRGVRGRSLAKVFVGVALSVLLWRALLVLVFHASPFQTAVTTDCRFDAILLGCALGVWNNPMLDDVAAPLPARWLRVWLPLSAATLLATFAIRAAPFQQTLRYTAQSVALVPIFVTAIRRPSWGPYRLLNTRWLRWLGMLSYTLYLVHQCALALVARLLPHAGKLACGVLALGLSLALAQLSYTFLEQPCARLRKRFA